jgi:hypothetical protein
MKEIKRERIDSPRPQDGRMIARAKSQGTTVAYPHQMMRSPNHAESSKLAGRAADIVALADRYR